MPRTVQTTLNARNGPSVYRQRKTKSPEEHYKTRCDLCLTKQRTRATEKLQRQKFEELANVPPNGQETEKKGPNATKVCVGEDSVTKCTIYNV